MMVQKYTYIFIDVEATLIRGKQYIIEIGAIKWLPDGKVEKFSELIRPYRFTKLNAHIQKLTGITTEQLLGAKSFREVMMSFKKWCSKDTIFITFGEFDRKVLEEEFARNYFDVEFLYPIIDFQQKYMIEHQIKEQPSLGGLLDKYNIAVDTQHRALADAVSLFHIFQATNGETLIEKQQTSQFGMVFSELRQLEDTYDLSISYIAGNVSSSNIEIDKMKIIKKQLNFDIHEEEKKLENGEKEIVQRTIIYPNDEVKQFLTKIIQDVNSKVLITRSGLKKFSRINRLHNCSFPKTEVMTLQHLLKTEENLAEFSFKDLPIQSYEQELHRLIKKYQNNIIQEYKRRNLFSKEEVKIS
ncbi:3'-5' exonuclease [Lysinibacillus sp. BW-2-10]|uniref:3'-5' exonuclease n=1 Tax=Lysinibacillus sp. BW-2-10 TaxID=2590030 RepID=UPI00210835B3|nr:3'-5' exonuclease [Lysinibacillus sp. BW-2-10]